VISIIVIHSCLKFTPAAQVQVAFGPGAPSPPLLIRKYNVPVHENTGSSWSGTEDTRDDDGKIFVPPSAARVDGAINPLSLKGKRQYKEPWVRVLSVPLSFSLSSIAWILRSGFCDAVAGLPPYLLSKYSSFEAALLWRP
jgi:hypothetical protein